MGARMSQILKHKLLFNLVDPQETRKHAMAMFDESDMMPAQRTQIKEIPPASIRIQSVNTRSLKGFEARVDEIRENEARFIAQKQAKLEEDHTYQHGLMYANLGSVYDVASTKASTDGRPASHVDTFEKVEKAVKTKPFKEFWSANTSEGPSDVKYQTQNRFEGRSSYFNYYPTDQLFEQKLEAFWWENQNRRL